MFKKSIILSFCFVMTGLFADGLENKPVVNESSCGKKSLEYEHLQSKLNELVYKVSNKQTKGFFKKIIAHTIILASSLGLSIGTQYCLDHFTSVESTKEKSTPVFMVSYILMRFFYEKLSKDKNSLVDLENLAKFIKNEAGDITGLSKDERALMIRELQKGFIQIEAEKILELFTSRGFIDHIYPLFPTYVLAEATASYLSGNINSFGSSGPSYDDFQKAQKAKNVYYICFFMLYYFALTGLFDYVLTPQDKASDESLVDLLKQITSSIDEIIKLDKAKVETCQA
jgi:hypothetical protein